MNGWLATWLPVATLAGVAISWLVSQWLHRRQVRRQATQDVVQSLKAMRDTLQEIAGKEPDANKKQAYLARVDTWNQVLVGAGEEILRRALRDAGLPTEEFLVAAGRQQLQPQQAENVRKALVEVDRLALPPARDILLGQGNAHYRTGQYQQALAMYNTALQLSADDAMLLNNRGAIYDNLGKYDLALGDYNRSLGLRPDDPDTLNNRGSTYDNLGKYDLALADYNRSLGLRPDDPATLNNRGVTYAHLGKYDLALGDYNRSLGLRPDHPATLYNLACLFSLGNRPDEAMVYLERAIHKDVKYRAMAQKDEDFANIRDDPRFRRLVGLP